MKEIKDAWDVLIELLNKNKIAYEENVWVNNEEHYGLVIVNRDCSGVGINYLPQICAAYKDIYSDPVNLKTGEHLKK